MSRSSSNPLGLGNLWQEVDENDLEFKPFAYITVSNEGESPVRIGLTVWQFAVVAVAVGLPLVALVAAIVAAGAFIAPL